MHSELHNAFPVRSEYKRFQMLSKCISSSRPTAGSRKYSGKEFHTDEPTAEIARRAVCCLADKVERPGISGWQIEVVGNIR